MQAIADELGVSKSAAFYNITEMAEKGIISYDGKTTSISSMQRSIYFAKRASIIGNIVCGIPEYSRRLCRYFGGIVWQVGFLRFTYSM